eukprot:scaffold167972_cov50-Cyclotella_meneghiniana.AAC.1
MNQYFYQRSDDDLILWGNDTGPVTKINANATAEDDTVEEAEDEVEGGDSDGSESEEEIGTSGEDALVQSIRWADELEQESAAGGQNSGAAAPTRSSMRTNFGVAPVRLIEQMNSNVTFGPGFAADMHYMHQLHEINNAELMALELSLVGAGFGTEFGTEDLK